MTMTNEPAVKAADTSIQIDTIHADVNNIPESTLRVAGYVTGSTSIRWTDADWARFTEATARVEINQDASSSPLDGEVFDIEGGAWSIDQAVEGAKERIRHGRDVSCYISAGGLSGLRSTLAAEGIHKAFIWLANWNLSMQEAVNMLETSGDYPIVCVQFASPSSNPDTIVPGSTLTLKEANVDLSVALDTWLRLPSDPTPPPPPAVMEAELHIPAVEAKVIKIQSSDQGKTWTEAA